MPYTQSEIENITQLLRESLGDNITWKFDEKFHGMLSEFAQNKSDVVLEKLRNALPHEWDTKTVKKLPKSMKVQLGEKRKLTKQQKILACEAQGNTPAIVALWWPWGHGGTYSLRILLLNENFENTPEQASQSGIFYFMKKIFS